MSTSHLIFLGLLLALRSHDQIPASHLSFPPPPKPRGVVDWCTHWPTCRALTRSCSGLHLWTNLYSLKNEESFPIDFYFQPKQYWCLYLHRSRDLVSPVCGIFFCDSNIFSFSYSLTLHCWKFGIALFWVKYVSLKFGFFNKKLY